MKLKISKSIQDVAANFSRYLATFISSRETVHIALSGGSTPTIVFDELVNNYLNDIDWKGVHLYWGDERCVEPTDNQSNYKMTLTHLISKITIPKENIHRIKGENNPAYEAKRYSEILEVALPKANNIPQFDLVILGMGDDGHTASIFPQQIELWFSEENCEVAIHPESGQKRVSLTGKIINNADTVAFLVTGVSKAEKFSEIKEQTGNYKNYPANLVRPSSGRLLWFLDSEAASLISNQS